MSLSVIVPVYNEGKTVAEIISRLLKIKPIKKIVVVDDKSTDNTPRVLKKISSHRLQIITHAVNQGKGAAIRTGIQHLKTSHFIIQDADLEYDPADISRLWDKIKQGKAKVVYGSRFFNGRGADSFWHYFGNWLLTGIANFLFNVSLTDMETCYKLLPTKLVSSFNLRARRFEFEPEVTARVITSGIKILEVPINYRARSYAEGKKINFWDALEAVQTLFYYRFSGRKKMIKGVITIIIAGWSILIMILYLQMLWSRYV